jgi:beta-1,4-N-acetylglucosaminyltransferase
MFCKRSLTFTVVSAATVTTILFVLRLLWILPGIHTQAPSPRKSSARLLVVLGSGGHTAEILRLLESLDFRNRYSWRVYVASSGDTLSEGKAREFEARKGGSEGKVFPLVSFRFLAGWVDGRSMRF